MLHFRLLLTHAPQGETLRARQGQMLGEIVVALLEEHGRDGDDI